MRRLDPSDERVVELDRMLVSPGWEKTALPALQGELAKARRQIEHAHDIAEVRGLQEKIRLLRRLIEEPRKFFSTNGKEIENERVVRKPEPERGR